MWFKHLQTDLHILWESNMALDDLQKKKHHGEWISQLAMFDKRRIPFTSLFILVVTASKSHRLAVLQADLRQIVAWVGRPLPANLQGYLNHFSPAPLGHAGSKKTG